MKEGLLYTVLLGGNEGDTYSVFENAVTEIIDEIGVVKEMSSLYASPPWGFEASQDFLNQVITIVSSYSPEEVMRKLLAIEKKLGRLRSEKKGYASRVIDLDILFQEDSIVSSEIVQLPHPRIYERRFTILPLVELMPEFVHPTLKVSMTELLAKCTDESEVLLCEK